jgi:DEAD/DEAH box helicase domain-containing protein
VNKQPKLYKKIKERSYENIGYGPITLPPFEYDTMGFSIFLPLKWKEVMDEIDKRYPGAAFYGLSYILKMTSPGLCMADRNDIDTDVSMNELDDGEWKSVLFLFDKIDGGVGYSEKIYKNIDKSLELCTTIIKECECESGCPACIPSLPPGVSNEELEDLFIESNASIECTKSLLEYLLSGKIIIPDIKIRNIPLVDMTQVIDNEKEVVELRNKLSKAAGILKRKRERLH